MSERDELAQRVEQARLAHNALWRGRKWLPPWRWLKTHETARAYRDALLDAALYDLYHPTQPSKGSDS